MDENPPSQSSFVSRPSRKILCITPNWVGDVIMSQALMKAIHHEYPGSTLHALSPTPLHGVLSRMPEVQKIWSTPFRHRHLDVLARWKWAKTLQAERYEAAYVLPNSWKAALIPFLARIPVRVGFLGEMRWGLLTHHQRLTASHKKKHLIKIVDRYLALLRVSGAPSAPTIAAHPEYRPALQPGTASVQTALLERLRLHKTPGQKIVALCPGAEFGPSKQYPATHMARLAALALKNGHAVWLLGSTKDQAICKAIQSALPHELGAHCDLKDLAGRTSLLEAIDVLYQTDLVISNDSGLMHLGAALGKPVLALYGSTSPESTPPLSPLAQIFRLELRCSPCFQRHCPLTHHQCLQQLSPDAIWEAAHAALAH